LPEPTFRVVNRTHLRILDWLSYIEGHIRKFSYFLSIDELKILVKVISVMYYCMIV